jgi:hypothetical protein
MDYFQEQDALFLELLRLLDLGDMADKLIANGLTDFVGH